jgi:hypothetical protein
MDRWAEPPIMEGPKTDGASGTSPSPGLSVGLLLARARITHRPLCPRRQVVLLAARPFLAASVSRAAGNVAR